LLDFENLVLRARPEIVGSARNFRVPKLSAASYQLIGQEKQNDTDVTDQKTLAELLQNHEEYTVFNSSRPRADSLARTNSEIWHPLSGVNQSRAHWLGY
jgi:hypothetical protein